jgi:phosphoglycolate phosphatase
VDRLVLWDVDGTLVRVGGAGREVFEVAVRKAFGRDVTGHGVAMSGKTDPEIAREILAFAAADDATADEHLAAVLEHLERELAGAVERMRQEGRVLPGVERLLPRLHDDPGMLQSVLTGNIAANALVKLAAFGLDRWLDLDVGAFGSDHHDRRELVPIAMKKARKRHGRSYEPADVWVVGDTPKDLACARAGGARCLLVATGHFPASELRSLEADAVLDDLTDVDRVLALLAG